MNMQELLKNPLVLAVIASAGTYGYLYWDNMQMKEKHPKREVEPVNLLIPLIVGLLVFVIAYNFFGNVQNNGLSADAASMYDMSARGQCNKFINKPTVLLSDGAESFHLVGKNAIRLPTADVFIDLAKF